MGYFANQLGGLYEYVLGNKSEIENIWKILKKLIG